MVSSLPEVLTVPVRPAVLKYLRRHLHLHEGQAFKLTKKGSVGRLLYHLLRNPQQDRQYCISKETHPVDFQVHISQQLSWLNGCRHLTDQGVHDFNRQVEDLIEQEFITVLDTLAAYNITFETKKAALDFKAMYDFTEEDMTLDALVKTYYRYRKAKTEAGKRLNLIPNCPAQLQALAA